MIIYQVKKGVDIMALSDILDIAEKFEIEGYNFYKSKRDEIRSSTAKETFDFLANMEKEHTEYIRRVKEKIENVEVVETNASETTEEFFEKRLKSQKLDESFSKENDLADLSILRMALLIEKDFVNYYAKAYETTVDEKAKKIFKMLKNWEEQHVKLVEELIKEIYDRNRLDLGFYPF